MKFSSVQKSRSSRELNKALLKLNESYKIEKLLPGKKNKKLINRKDTGRNVKRKMRSDHREISKKETFSHKKGSFFPNKN